MPELDVHQAWREVDDHLERIADLHRLQRIAICTACSCTASSRYRSGASA